MSSSLHLQDNPPFMRLWAGFLSARVLVALALLVLQSTAVALGQATSAWSLATGTAYLAATFILRLARYESPPSPQPGLHWLPSLGVDLLAITSLQALQASGSMNYMPLYGFSVLMAAILGSQTLAFGTSAAATLLMLALAWWSGRYSLSDTTTNYLTAALTGTGYFIVAYLTHQLATRLLREQQRAHQSLVAARTQEAVSQMVVQHVSDGVLVLDRDGQVRMLNPVAQALMGEPAAAGAPFTLAPEQHWQPLLQLARKTFTQEQVQSADITILHQGQNPMVLRVRTWLTFSPISAGREDQEQLCVVFLHDLRAMEARLRTEKMAAMGRMSAAVAHEIRNPLAAIMQATQLLDEDLSDATHKRLTGMVRQNAERLKRITEDVLDIAHVQHEIGSTGSSAIALDATVLQILRDWQATNPTRCSPVHQLQAGDTSVAFDADHLRRVLVNLLDNAARYVSDGTDALQIITRDSVGGAATLQVWSDGAPLDKSVRQHLFDPFFSSESRSSGLGLYICRELCQRHGATLSYQRTSLEFGSATVEGNAFTVTFRAPSRPADAASLFDTIVV